MTTFGSWSRSLSVRGFLTLVLLFGLIGSAAALEPTDKWEGSIDYAATGGTFLNDTCQASAFGCVTGVFDGQGDSVTANSQADLDGIPDDANVVKAYLVWMGSIQHGVDSPDDTINIRPPQGNSYTIVAEPEQLSEIVYDDLDANDQMATYHYFTYRVEVTEILRRHVVSNQKPLNGTYLLSGFSAYAGEPYLSRTVALGGWSLFIVYSVPQSQPKRVYYYTDFRAIHDEVVELNPAGFEVPENPEAKVTFFLGEGDQGIRGMGLTGTHNEELRFNGTVLVDACNDADNAYNSTVNTNIYPNEEPCRINQYSIDLDTFFVSNLLGLGDTEAQVLMSLGQDQAFSNYLILSIDTKLPDFDIPNEPEKASSVTGALYPGQEFTYYIYVQNNGEDIAANVRVRDELPLDVTYVAGSTVVVEPSGERVAVADGPNGEAPCLSGIDVADTMPPGEGFRRTIEFKVRLNSVEQGVTKETIVENMAEIISGNGDIYFTNGGIPVRHNVQLESFEGTLYFKKGPRHPGSHFVAGGEQRVTVAHLNLKALEGDIQMSSLMFTPMADTDALVISGAELYLDNNNDGLLDSGDDMIDSRQSWTSGGLVFDDFSRLPEVEANEQHNLLLVVDIADDVQPGQIAQLELIEDNVGVRGFTSGLPFACATLYVPSEDTDLSMELGFMNPSDGYLSQGAVAPVMQLLVRAYSDGVSLSGLTISAEGTVHDSTEVTAMDLITDINGNGLKDPGEPALGGSQTFGADNAAVTFSGLNLSVPNGGEAYLLLVGQFSETIGEEKKFRVLINNNDQLEAGGKVVLGAPISGSLFTFTSGQVVECTTDAECAQELGASWVCDQINGLCVETSVPDGDNPADGDDPADGDAWTPDGDTGDDEDDGGGCRTAGSSGAMALMLLFAVLSVTWIRRRREN